MKKISVIVPVYNVASYLETCLDSILGQEYKYLDVILIDDGSTDASGKICDLYAQKDDRIRVIHQKNAGAAAAKNTGLRVAEGEYLSFVDSDDYLAPNAYAHMVALMEENEADVVQCRIQYLFQDGKEVASPELGCRVFTGKQYTLRYTEDWTCALMTDKLYKRSLYQGIFFEEGHAIDDEFFTYQGIMNADRVICDDQIIYNYRMRQSSVMHSPQLDERKLMDRIDYLWKRRNHVIARFPELRRIFNSDFLDGLLSAVQNVNSTEKTIGFAKQMLKSYLCDKNKTLPGPRSWGALLFLYFASTKKLLGKCDKNVAYESDKKFFP